MQYLNDEDEVQISQHDKLSLTNVKKRDYLLICWLQMKPLLKGEVNYHNYIRCWEATPIYMTKEQSSPKVLVGLEWVLHISKFHIFLSSKLLKLGYHKLSSNATLLIFFFPKFQQQFSLRTAGSSLISSRLWLHSVPLGHFSEGEVIVWALHRSWWWQCVDKWLEV